MNIDRPSNNSTSSAKINPAYNALLVLPDGSLFYGYGVGKKGEAFGEICFNTSITGYQEILTDPSYSGQIIVFTFPHIGNVGVNQSDIESITPRASGLVIRDTITNPSNYRSGKHLNNWLEENSLTGISGLDTRKLTRIIKNKGARNVAIVYKDNLQEINLSSLINKLNETQDLKGVELASKASTNQQYPWQNQGIWQQYQNSYHQIATRPYKVIAIDYGAKLNILRCLTQLGCEVTVVPSHASAEEILSYKPDGVFLSNGPGDPAETAKYAAPVIRSLIDKNIAVFGICLGHQLIALAMGGQTSKMPQGHRGANHPVQNLKTGKVEITSQNHGFCVDPKTLPSSLEVTHLSLFDKTIEGLKVKDKKAFSVQYHPESSPGPNDSFYLFEEFISLMKN